MKNQVSDKCHIANKATRQKGIRDLIPRLPESHPVGHKTHFVGAVAGRTKVSALWPGQWPRDGGIIARKSRPRASFKDCFLFSSTLATATGKSSGPEDFYEKSYRLVYLNYDWCLFFCTDSSNPNNRKNMFESYYPGLAAETRPVSLVQGSTDPLCDTNHFQEYLKGKPNNFISIVTKGDHSLGIKNPDGQYNAELGKKNLQAISKWIFSWLTGSESQASK